MLTTIACQNKLVGKRESHAWIEQHLHRAIELWNLHFWDKEQFDADYKKEEDQKQE